MSKYDFIGHATAQSRKQGDIWISDVVLGWARAHPENEVARLFPDLVSIKGLPGKLPIADGKLYRLTLEEIPDPSDPEYVATHEGN